MKWKHILIILMLLPAYYGFSQDKYTLSGVIIDSESGKALNGIDVVIKDENTGTISNQTGSFLLHLNQGKYNITISGKGYSQKELKINLDDNIEKDISLSPVKNKEKKPQKKKLKKNNIHTTLLSLL